MNIRRKILDECNVIHDPSERKYIPIVPGEKIAIMIPSRCVAGRFAVVESVTEPSAATPHHVHEGDELFYVTEGEMTFSIDGNLSKVGPHGLVHVPGGVVHAFRNCSKERARMLVFYAPGGIDEVLEKFTELTFAEIENLSLQYGTRIVGPPIES